MGYTNEILDDVLRKLHPGDDVITVARERRDEVLEAAADFKGCLRTYISGSLAHHVANFDTDADCGAVLDRRTYPELGPDGDGEGPRDIVEAMRQHVRERLKPDHPDIAFRVTKRAVRVTYKEPLADGTDPPVDLIVALTRKQPALGLWIPNTERDDWDASHPERHTELLTADPKALRQKRARVIRLAKGENGEHAKKALCSFNLEALALESVVSGTGLGTALADFFDYGADELRRRNTPDPAGVSPPIKTLIDRSKAADRLERAGKLVREALENDDDECAVRGALAKVFPSLVDACAESDQDTREALRRGDITTAGYPVPGLVRDRQRSTRAYGDPADAS